MRSCRCSPSRITISLRTSDTSPSSRPAPRLPLAFRASRSSAPGSPPRCTTSASRRSPHRSSTSPALDAGERALVERHTVIGERILAAAPTLRAIAPIVRASHERPDGTGYPDGLRLEEIPICARIIAVVDAYDAMTSDRAYRRAMPVERAIAELHRHAGTQFDARVVDAVVVALTSRQPLALAAYWRVDSRLGRGVSCAAMPAQIHHVDRPGA